MPRATSKKASAEKATAKSAAKPETAKKAPVTKTSKATAKPAAKPEVSDPSQHGFPDNIVYVVRNDEPTTKEEYDAAQTMIDQWVQYENRDGTIVQGRIIKVVYLTKSAAAQYRISTSGLDSRPPRNISIHNPTLRVIEMPELKETARKKAPVVTAESIEEAIARSEAHRAEVNASRKLPRLHKRLVRARANFELNKQRLEKAQAEYDGMAALAPEKAHELASSEEVEASPAEDLV